MALLPVPASADGLSFGDLSGCSPSIPASYHCLNWSSGFQVECNSDYAASYGNSYGAPSGYAATNGSLNSGLMEVSVSSGTFTFNSAAFSSFAGSDAYQAYSALSLQLYAYRPGDTPDNPTFVTTIDLDPTKYVTTVENWADITSLFFGAGNGPASDINTIFGTDGLSWLMTDMAINQPSATPEPAAGILLGACLALGLFALRSKRLQEEN
jgi:hypothetical protein